jgi:uncharacterized protein
MIDRPINDNSYQQFLNEEKIMGSKCEKCGAQYVPPRPICRKCKSTKMQWIELKGEGTLAAFTRIFVGPPYMTKLGYDRKHPYISGVVDLGNGLRVDARIEGIDEIKSDDINIGMPLVVKYLHQGEGGTTVTTLAFSPPPMVTALG